MTHTTDVLVEIVGNVRPSAGIPTANPGRAGSFGPFNEKDGSFGIGSSRLGGNGIDGSLGIGIFGSFGNFMLTARGLIADPPELEKLGSFGPFNEKDGSFGIGSSRLGGNGIDGSLGIGIFGSLGSFKFALPSIPRFGSFGPFNEKDGSFGIGSSRLGGNGIDGSLGIGILVSLSLTVLLPYFTTVLMIKVGIRNCLTLPETC